MDGHDSTNMNMNMDMNGADPAGDEVVHRVEIAVVEDGKAQPVTLVFTRKTDETCTKEAVVELGADRKSSGRCR